MSISGVLYVGVTSNLIKRVNEHKEALVKSFTQKYKCKKLVYYEETNDVESAINREKKLKNWNRAKKEKLIKTMNPEYADLSLEWF